MYTLLNFHRWTDCVQIRVVLAILSLILKYKTIINLDKLRDLDFGSSFVIVTYSKLLPFSEVYSPSLKWRDETSCFIMALILSKCKKGGLTEETSFVLLCPTCVVIRGDISNVYIIQVVSCLKAFNGFPLDRMKIKFLWNGQSSSSCRAV